MFMVFFLVLKVDYIEGRRQSRRTGDRVDCCGDGDGIAVYGTINWGCVSCCAKVVNF
jgi:hypothetical protein